MKFLAQGTELEQIFGTPINAPGPAGLNTGTVPDSFALFFSFLVNMFLAIAVLASLIYLMLGGIKWVTSGGDADKLAEARNQIMQAIVGVIILIAVFVIWVFIASTVIGTIDFVPGEGLRFDLPSIGGGD
jgi:hypothetical protein